VSGCAGRFSIYLANPSWVQPSKGDWYVSADSLGIDWHAPEDSLKVTVTDQDFLSTSTEPMSTYPNPVSTELTVEFSYEDGEEGPTASQLQVLLYNAVGMRVDPQSFIIRYQIEHDRSGERLPKGFVRFILSVENLSPGTYLLRVDWGRQTNWVRFAKT